ncbi:MAG: hypothetical protein J6B45_03040 [Clostridia bacterium]|nr:hypothetical protein [Clostridia bacterium]
MKKVLAFLLAVMMFSSVFFVNAFAVETTSSEGDPAEQGNTTCTCGGTYGEWRLPDNGVCVGGRYTRVCGNDSCGKVQTAKDITPKTISFAVPAIGANIGDLVMLSLYDVYFTSSNVVAAENIVWSSEDIEIVNNQICPTEKGTYKLTATSGTSTKSVYLVVKNPTDTEYVLFLDDFGRDTNGDGKIDDNDTGVTNIPTKDDATVNDYKIIQQPSGTSAYIQGGKLVLNTLGNANNQMRVLLPEWIGDFGEYKIDTVFTIDSTVSNDTSRWFATMARVQNDSDYFPIWQAAVRKAAKSHSSGVEISYTGNGTSWEVPCKGKYTENIDSAKYYTQTLNVVGTEAYHSIDGTLIQSTENASKHLGAGVGLVGFHLRAALVYIDSVKIAVPIDDSIHDFGDWTTKKAATCTVDGTETRTCKNCNVTEERVIKAEHKGFGDWTVITPATCTTKGAQQRVCADCGKVESNTINATGHSLVKQAVKAPTCIDSGYREYNICANCDYTTFAGMVDPYGHYFDREIKSIAHRGFSSTAPENTLPAYILAKEKGFSYVECDIAFTKDGIAVLLHDATIDRTSDGSGNIIDLTYEELLHYDFGSWKGSKYAGTKIPTFEEFIALCKELGLHPYMEIKNDATYTQEQVQSLVDIVKKYGMEDNCTWISFNLTYLEYVKSADDTARLGYVSSKNVTQSMINSVKALQTGKNEVFLDISYNMLNENNVMLAIQNGLEIETWTVDNVNDIKARPKYISGYTSNKLIATDTLVKTAVTAPTCGAQGYTTYTCLCGATKIDNYVPATEAHTYENGVCTGCGKALYCADPTHNLEIISISYANGFDKAGVKVVKCLDCNTDETETVAPALYACVGYAMSENGSNSIAVGFEVNNKAMEEYEAVTGKTLEIGVVFAGYDNLAGKQPLDENGKAVSLDVGKVIKAELSGYDYKIYDFVLTDIDDSIKDVKLVIAAYIYDGEGVSYLQESGAGGTVSGVSYNEVMERIK